MSVLHRTHRMPTQLPYLVRQQEVDVDGVPTGLCLTVYANTVLLIATQTGSVAVWLRARRVLR